MASPILLYDTITNESAKEVTEAILSKPEGEDVELWIDSPGGSVTAGWAIIAAMQQRNVNMTVTGDASSMAFIMLAFANHVKVFDTSNGLLHRAASWWEEIMDEDELKDIDNRNKVIRKKLESKIDIEAFQGITGKTFDDVFTMDDRLDVRLNASQMKEIGLVDEVVKIDTKKRKEIESNYKMAIAALANNEVKTSINIKSKKMGLKDLFKSKDPILTATIDGNQVIYDKIAMGEFVKPLGEGVEAVNGSFEAQNKKITVKDNEITAVEEVDYRALINALSSKVDALEKAQISAEEIKDVLVEQLNARDAKIEALEKTIKEAKISVSSPQLPEAEFEDDKVVEDITLREKIAKIQAQKYEEKRKKREE